MESQIDRPIGGCGEKTGPWLTAVDYGVPYTLLGLTLLTLTFGLWRAGLQRMHRRPDSWLATPLGKALYFTLAAVAGMTATAAVYVMWGLASIGGCAG